MGLRNQIFVFALWVCGYKADAWAFIFAIRGVKGMGEQYFAGFHSLLVYDMLFCRQGQPNRDFIFEFVVGGVGEEALFCVVRFRGGGGGLEIAEESGSGTESLSRIQAIWGRR